MKDSLSGRSYNYNSLCHGVVSRTDTASENKNSVPALAQNMKSQFTY